MPDDITTPIEVGTELLDAVATRVDGVKGPATKLGFLMFKSESDQDTADIAAALEATAAAVDVAKDDGTVDLTVGDPANDAPGSAEWEAQDSAALSEIATQLATLIAKVKASATRERAEVEAGADWDDIEDAWSLDDAAYCLDGALDVVAGMVFTEQSEAENGGSVTKSLRRPLSDKARATIAKAYTTLTEIVGGTKGTIMSPEDITALVNATADAAVAKALAGAAPAPAAVEPPAADAPVVKAEGDQPVAEVAAVVEPSPEAVDVVKQMTDVFKSAVAETFTAAMAEDGALGTVLKSLNDRIAVYENAPAKGGPLLGGVAGNGYYVAVRGEASAVGTAGTDEREPLVKELAESVSPERQAEILTEISRINLRNMYEGK